MGLTLIDQAQLKNGTAAGVAATRYAFAAQSPGGSLGVGANTVTLSPVPPGVNGTDVGHYLYITGGTGTAEAVLITGGTATSGAASGTVIFTAANTHSGAWKIQSATGGIQEAALASNLLIWLDAGTIEIYAKITFPQNHSGMVGQGGGSINFGYGTYLKVHFTTSDFIYCNIPTALRLEHFSVVFVTAATAGTVINMDDTGGGIVQTVLINDVSVWGGWQGVSVVGNTFYMTNCQIAIYYRGIIIGSAARAAGPFMHNVIVTNIGTSGGAPVGGIGVLVNQTTGGFISNLIVGGPFDYGQFFNSVGPVHECEQANFLIDGYRIGGLWVTPGADMALWNFSNFEVNASLQLGTEQSIQLSSTSLCSFTNFNVGAGAQAFVIQGSGNRGITISNGILYSGTPVAASLVDLSGNFRDITITGLTSANTGTARTVGFKLDLSTSSAGGLVISDNNIGDGNTTPLTVNGSCPNVIIANNAGVDTFPTVASGASVALPVGPSFFLSGNTGVGTVTAQWEAKRGTFIATHATPGTWTAGTTIGNTFTPTQNKPVNFICTGGKIYLS